MSDQPNRIKISQRPARPLPAPPSLAAAVKGGVVTKVDAIKWDAAMADWFRQFQTVFADEVHKS